MTNRIDAAITTITEKVAEFDAETLARQEENAELDFRDWFDMGDKSSLAVAHGIVTLDEAATLHRIHTDYNTTATLAEKITFMMTMGQILPALAGIPQG